jgi:protein arginine N-methyltransferase 1
MRIEYHRVLIADRVRNAAFTEALRRVIVRGQTRVADIGAGTGLLGFLAARLGAGQVVLYETAEVADVAARLARQNRIRNCTIVTARSTEVEAPERADVVVSETLGNYVFEEHLIETVNDARRRILAPGGELIPRRIRQFVCPVVNDRFHRELCAWEEIGHGLDFTPAKVMSLNNIYVRWFDPADLMDGASAAQLCDEADLQKPCKSTRSGEADWRFGEAQEISGFALWWAAELVDGLWLATGPLDPRTHWEQLYLPTLKKIRVKAGETLAFRFRSITSQEGGTDIAWSAAHLDAGGRAIQRQSLALEKGFLP